MKTATQAALDVEILAKEIAKLGRADFERQILKYGYSKIKDSTASLQSPKGDPWAPKMDGSPAGRTISQSIVLTENAVRSTKSYALYFHARRKRVKSSIGVRFGKKYSVKKVSIRTKVAGSRPIMPGFKFPRSWDLSNPTLKALRKALRRSSKYIF